VQHLASGPQVLASIEQRLLHRCFGGVFGLLLVLADQMDERLDQVVVDLPEAMKGEAQQVQPRCTFGHALQLVGSVELDQRRIVFAALVGQTGRDEEVLSELVQRLEEFPPLDLTLELLMAEVFGLALECADAVHLFISL
jgi:hypothetical protein